ncbi:MAG: SDR family oxidoreductase [Terriglobia bacterium]
MNNTQPKALVTGASSGIGAATAIELAKRGFAVAVHYFNNEEGGRQTVKTIQENGGTAIGIKADVRILAEVENLIQEVVRQFQGIDVLVNNAGSMIGRVPFLEMTESYWKDIFQLNVHSVFYCSQLAAKVMVKQKKGIIINVSSIAARQGGGNGAIAYAASKGAVQTFTKGMARELAPYGIRVNGVNPGVILTPFHARFSTEKQIQQMVDTVVLKHAGSPEEVATVIAFLASYDARYLTGETIEAAGVHSWMVKREESGVRDASWRYGARDASWKYGIRDTGCGMERCYSQMANDKCQMTGIY